jgi:hypothetical protein
MSLYLSRTLLPHLLFFVLLAAGWWMAELSNRRIATFLGIWLGTILVFRLLPFGGLWTTAIVAIMDIVLILMVFKRDIRI